MARGQYGVSLSLVDTYRERERNTKLYKEEVQISNHVQEGGRDQ